MSKKRNGEYMDKTKFGIREYSALIVCLIVGMFSVAIMLFTDNSSKKNKNESSNGSIENSKEGYEIIDLLSSESEEVLLSNDTSEESSEEKENFDIIEIDSSSVYKGDLILVNKKNHYMFAEEEQAIDVYDLKTIKYKLGTGEEKLFEKTILSANDFLGDFYDLSGKTNVTMINGFITKEEQQQKYEKYIKSVSAEEAQKWGVKAGESDHHTGLSFNLMLYPSGGKIGEGEYSWLIENAHRYGFVLRYPADKSEITQVKDDNHFRYVGIPHAEYMYSNKLTLEEYIELLEKTSYSSPLKIISGNEEYLVYYSPADKTVSKTEIKVPKGMSYNISGDNSNGFIITAFNS